MTRRIHIQKVLAAFQTIYKHEGLKSGLYRGLSLNYMKTLPNVAIYLSLYDYMKTKLVEYDI